MESLAPLMDHLSLNAGAGFGHHPIVGVCQGQPASSTSNCSVFDTTNFNPTLNYFYNYAADKVRGYDSLTDMTLWPNIIVATMSIFNHTFVYSLWAIVVSILFLGYLGKYDGVIKKQQEEYANQ